MVRSLHLKYGDAAPPPIPHRLAARRRSRPPNLQTHASLFPRRRTIRVDFTNAARRVIGSPEHRRRIRTQTHGGALAVSAYIVGVARGAGLLSPRCGTSRLHPCGAAREDAEGATTSRRAAQRPHRPRRRQIAQAPALTLFPCQPSCLPAYPPYISSITRPQRCSTTARRTLSDGVSSPPITLNSAGMSAMRLSCSYCARSRLSASTTS
jgi:hypothetical protein